MAETAFRYLLFTVFVTAFAGIYEYFSFGVWSAAMVYAPAVPLIMGAVPALYLATAKRERILPGRVPLLCYHAGTVTLTVGCIVKGVLDIYGTTNRLICFYPIAGALMIAAAVFTFTGACRRRRLA